MSKAENYISEHTKHCSNSYWDKHDGDSEYPWLIPDDAREEIYEWLRVNLCNYFDAPRSMFEMCLDNLKQTMKDG